MKCDEMKMWSLGIKIEMPVAQIDANQFQVQFEFIVGKFPCENEMYHEIPISGRYCIVIRNWPTSVWAIVILFYWQYIHLWIFIYFLVPSEIHLFSLFVANNQFDHFIIKHSNNFPFRPAPRLLYSHFIDLVIYLFVSTSCYELIKIAMNMQFPTCVTYHLVRYRLINLFSHCCTTFNLFYIYNIFVFVIFILFNFSIETVIIFIGGSSHHIYFMFIKTSSFRNYFGFSRIFRYLTRFPRMAESSLNSLWYCIRFHKISLGIWESAC